MKRINIIKQAALLTAMVVVWSGCDNADYKTIDNAIYWEEASTAMAEKITVDPEKSMTTAITARLASPLSTDVKAEVVIDPDFLAAYNKAHQTNYDLLPGEYCTFDKSIVIKAGEALAQATEFTIQPYAAPNGEQYALPVKLKVTEGAVTSIGESGSFILLLNQPLVQAVPQLKSANMAQTNPDVAWNEVTNEWTLEGWVQMDGFAINNQAIFNSGGKGTEVYVRFGDASIPYNSLQIKTMGSQVNTVTLFEANKWYHVALTYNAAGLVTVYINGIKDVTLQTKGGPANFEQMQIVTSGSYFRNRCMMAQLRLWKVTLTPTQILSNMFYAAKSDDPNLMGYWKMNEGEGNLFKDSTPNGRDMTAGGTFDWAKNIRFDK